MGHTVSEFPPRRFRWVRWLLSIILVAALIGGYYAYQKMTDPERIRRISESYLEKITSRDVSITAALFSMSDGIHLHGVSITDSPPSDTSASTKPRKSGEFFSCDEIFIVHDPWALLTGRLKFESFAANRPTLTLVHDADVGWENVATLVRRVISRPDSGNSAPPVELREARLRLMERSAQGDRLVEDVALTIRGKRDTDNPRIFNIVWQDAVDPDANGHSQIDLESGALRNVRGGLPTMSLRGIMVAVDAGFEGADALTDLLGIEGRVRVRDYNLMAPPLHDGPRSATIDLKDAAISIPVSDSERKLDSDERYLRFSRVNGSVVITAGSVQADFRGEFHRGSCTVSALISGPLRPGMTLADVSVRADVSAQNLLLPDPKGSPPERSFIERWPQLSQLFRQYDPHGFVDLDVEIEKEAGSGASFKVGDATVTARGGDISCHYFPYRGRQLTGRIRFGSDGVVVENVCGVNEKAEVCVNGWMEAPNRFAAARFDIHGKRVPVNDELLDSLPQQPARWIRDYQVAGAVDTEVTITRERSNPALGASPWDNKIQVRFDDLSARFSQFPIPVTGIAGSATVTNDVIEVPLATGRVEDGTISVNGIVDTHAGGLNRLSCRISANDIALSKQLLDAAPVSLRDKLDSLQADGCVSLDSTLDVLEDHSIRHATNVRLRDLTLRPTLFPIAITQGWADLRLDTNNVELLRARGYFGESELFAKGQSGNETQSDGDWVLEAQSLVINQELIDAAPPPVRAALSDWRIDKPVGVQLRVRQQDGALDWSGRVQINDSTIHYRNLPNPLDSVFATIQFSPGELRCSQAQARYAGASIDADVTARLNASPASGRIRLDVKGLELDDYTRSLLPEQAKRVWDQLTPSGRVDVVVDDVQFQAAHDSQPSTWSVDGKIFPREVRLNQDKVTIRSGVVPFEGMLVDRLGGITLSGELRESQTMLFDQQIDSANANWFFARTASGQGRAAITGFRGQVHQGSATSEAQLVFDGRDSQYRIEASIQEAQLEPWIDAWRAARSDTESTELRRGRRVAEEVRGTLNAEVRIAGTLDDPASRTGGGQFEVRDGYIYKLPIFLAILNVLNINVPNNDVLSEAESQFFITGNTVRLNNIEIMGDSLSLVGSGTLSLSDHSVDLTLMNAGGGRLASVPVLAELWEGASRELVELRVTGPLSSPQVRASPFRGMTEEFKKLFQKRKPRRTLRAEGS